MKLSMFQDLRVQAPQLHRGAREEGGGSIDGQQEVAFMDRSRALNNQGLRKPGSVSRLQFLGKPQRSLLSRFRPPLRTRTRCGP